jgi:hypothetical protein
MPNLVLTGCSWLLLALVLGAPVAAQVEYDPAVGEVILCSPVENERDWRLGEVIENNPGLNFVRVKCGPSKTGSPGGNFIINRKYLRPRTDPEAQKRAGVGPAEGQAASAAATPHATAAKAAGSKVATAQVDSPPPTSTLAPGSDLSGNSLEAILKRVIAARYIKDGHALDAGHTPSTITFHTFTIGKPRPYRLPIPGAYETGSPDGPGGRVGTLVYPVKTTYTRVLDYPGYPPSGYKGRIDTIEYDCTYWCFQNPKGEWLANQAAGSKVGDRRSVDK